MSQDFTATVRDTVRVAEWEAVFGDTNVCIKSPVPIVANLPGRPGVPIYELDLAQLTAVQRERLIAHIAAKFNIPADEVAADLDTIGVPILADDVTITIHNPQKWL